MNKVKVKVKTQSANAFDGLIEPHQFCYIGLTRHFDHHQREHYWFNFELVISEEDLATLKELMPYYKFIE